MRRQNFLWALVIFSGLLISFSYAAGWINLSLFFVAEGIIITAAAGLRRREP